MPYVLTRQNWRRIGDGVYRLPGTVDIDTFATADEAQQRQAELTATARNRVNPFTWGDGLFDVTGLPPFALADWMQDADLTPPPADAHLVEWQAWWDGMRSEATPRQFERAWQAFGKIDWYAVEERENRPVVWAAYQTSWHHQWVIVNGREVSRFSRASEGGHRVGLFRTESAAREWTAANLADAVAAHAHRELGIELEVFDTDSEALFRADPAAERPTAGGIVRAAQAPHFEVMSLPVFGDANLDHPTGVPIILRSGWGSTTSFNLRSWVEGGLLPLRVYANREVADAAAWNLDLEGRRYLNPFRFGHPIELTSLPEASYRAMIGDLDLDLPLDDWVGWWEQNQSAWVVWWERASWALTASQRDMVWDLLDGLRLHTTFNLVVQD